jgi:TIR domain-containing protein
MKSVAHKTAFISFAWHDRKLARNTVRQLREKGLIEKECVESIDCPEKLPETAALRKVIEEQIRGSDMLVLVWSKQAARSPWVQYEVGMAKALERPILVAWADKSAPSLPAEIGENEIVKLEGEVA